ncbi:MAG: GGDEF domain-containing protein [Planctomycetota bacterium]
MSRDDSIQDVLLHPHARPRTAAEPAPSANGTSVLLADHRGAGLAQLGAELEGHGVAIEVTEGLAGSLEALRSGRPSAVVLDPAGVGLLELTKLLALADGVPFVLVVDPSDPLPGLKALDERGRPLLAPFRRGAPALELWIQLRALASAAEWCHRAIHDERTELLRPGAFEARVREQISAATRHGFPIGLALFDLDDFGLVNKAHDHVIGDRVITAVGSVVRRTLRAEDLAGRIGGDEFGLALPYSGVTEARACVERLLTALGEERVPTHDGRGLRISASAGIAVLEPAKDPVSLAGVRRRAEEALRRAKRGGGSRAVVWSEREDADALLAAD